MPLLSQARMVRAFRWLLLHSVRLGVLAASVLVGAWHASVILSVDAAQAPVSALAEVRFTVEKGQPRKLGRRDLGQPPGEKSAEVAHLSFEHGSDGGLYLRKTAEERRLDLYFTHGGRSVYSDRFRIPDAGQGHVEIDIAGSAIRLTRQSGDLVRVERPAVAGLTTPSVEIGGSGQVVVSGGNKVGWCNADTGFLYNYLGWPVRLFSWKASNLSLRVNPFAKGNARVIAQLGGPETCRLAGGVVQVALEQFDPEVALGIRRFADKAGVRVYVFPARIPSNVPVSFRRVETGKPDVQPDQFDRLVWLVSPGSSLVAQDEETVSGFTAGYTRYRIETSFDANRDVWNVRLLPASREAFFDKAICATLFGVWPDQTMTDEQTRQLQHCPGPSRKENVDLTFVSADVTSPVTRLFRGNTARYEIDAALPGDFAYGRGILSRWERLTQTTMVIVALLLLVRVSISKARHRSVSVGVRRIIAAGAFIAVVTPIAASSSTGLSDHALALVPLFSNLALFVLAAIAAFADGEGGLQAQVFQLVVFAMVLLGGATLFTLSAEGPTADWERFFVKHKLFFLDLLPLYWIVFTLGSAQNLRNAFGATLVGKDRWYSVFRIVPAILILVFLTWFLVGTQQGLLGFQPVEIGKFVVLVGFAGILARWALRARMIKSVQIDGTILGIGIVTFLILLLVVPVLKSDFSPVIIIGFSLTLTACFTTVMTLWRVFFERKADKARLRELPVRSLPSKAQMLNGSEWRYIGIAAALLVGVVVGAKFAHDQVVPPGWDYGASSAKKVETARAALGEGRRTVPERLLNWGDMQYGALRGDPSSGTSSTPTISDRGLAYQGLRSRAAIAHSSCAASPEVAAFLTWLRADKTIADLSKVLDYMCHERIDNREIATENCSTPDLTSPVEPHCIPVIQSDFIGTFVLARHGQATGIALMFLQFIFVVIGLRTYANLRQSVTREPVVTAAMDAFATMVLGATLLFFAQWVLSWGNVFVLLPIMGQPMTFVSAAISHHLFMALPAVIVMLVGLRVAGVRQNTIPFRHHP